MRDYNHGRFSNEIWAEDGRQFRQKPVIFMRFSSVIMIFFSLIELISFIDPLHQKEQQSLMLEVAKVLKFSSVNSRSDPLKLIPPLSPKFFR